MIEVFLCCSFELFLPFSAYAYTARCVYYCIFSYRPPNSIQNRYSILSFNWILIRSSVVAGAVLLLRVTITQHNTIEAFLIFAATAFQSSILIPRQLSNFYSFYQFHQQFLRAARSKFMHNHKKWTEKAKTCCAKAIRLVSFFFALFVLFSIFPSLLFPSSLAYAKKKKCKRRREIGGNR